MGLKDRRQTVKQPDCCFLAHAYDLVKFVGEEDGNEMVARSRFEQSLGLTKKE